jgi:uncharacterized protein YecE (DUF72 family)
MQTLSSMLGVGRSALGVFCLFWADGFVYFNTRKRVSAAKLVKQMMELLTKDSSANSAPHYFSTTIVPVIFG